MNPKILEILSLYLAKLQVLTEGERKVIMDTIKLYIYPKYVIDKMIKWEGKIGGDPNNPFQLPKKENEM